MAAFGADCSERMAEHATAMLETQTEDRVGFAVGAVSAVCRESDLAPSFRRLQEVSPARRSREELRLVLAHPALWRSLCGETNGVRMVSAMAELPIAERRAHLWRTCPLAETQWMTQTEFADADGLLLAPFLAGATLLDGGITLDRARVIVRGISGL